MKKRQDKWAKEEGAHEEARQKRKAARDREREADS
jgi:hypothetical protein